MPSNLAKMDATTDEEIARHMIEDAYDWEKDNLGSYNAAMKAIGDIAKKTGIIPECLLGDGEHTQRLLAEREQTHGDFQSNAFLAQRFRYLFRSHGGWDRLSDIEREALDNIATKLSRIMSAGKDPDSWRDIAGYATLALRGCDR